MARSALWGLPKATDEELSKLQVILDELVDDHCLYGDDSDTAGEVTLEHAHRSYSLPHWR